MGDLIQHNIDAVQKEHSQGSIIILWTCRNGEYLEQAVQWCENHDVPFDYVNKNAKEVLEAYGNIDSRKITATEYWDDHAVLKSEHMDSSKKPLIEREWSMPNKNTFDIPPIHRLLCSEVGVGLWIDPFANKSKFATITNDLNPEFDTDYHLNALDFLKLFDDESVDGVLFDPPFSSRQIMECYKGFGIEGFDGRTNFWSDIKNEIARIVKPEGKVLCFGWNSMGIGLKRGFDMKRILIVPHGGSRNDTICTVETKRIVKKNKFLF
jgi:hypothetical protein